MIPKVIHQIYFDLNGGIENKPLFVKSIHSYKSCMPDYLHILWSRSDCERLIKNYMPKVFNFYKNLKYDIQRIDFAKFVIIYLYGGFYSDLDIIANKSFNDLLRKNLIFYKHAKSNKKNPYNGKKEKYANDFFGSEKNSNLWLYVIKECIINYRTVASKPIYDIWKGRFVLQTTGPYFFTRAILKYENQFNLSRLSICYCAKVNDEVNESDYHITNIPQSSWFSSLKK